MGGQKESERGSIRKRGDLGERLVDQKESRGSGREGEELWKHGVGTERENVG